MASLKVMLRGGSGALYVFAEHNFNREFYLGQPGLFALLRAASTQSFTVLALAEHTNLFRLPEHLLTSAHTAHAATHSVVRIVPEVETRRSELADLIAAYDPVMKC